MKKTRLVILAAVLLAGPFHHTTTEARLETAAIPPGDPDFLEEVVQDGLTQAVGMTFIAGQQMIIWEKAGIVKYRQNDNVAPRVVLDISEEVADFHDHGLLGLALHPDFEISYERNYIYLFYTVDWEYYLAEEVGRDAPLDPDKLDDAHDTFGRLVRYEVASDYTIIPESRLILIGETHEGGIAITTGSHGADTLAFGRDGTLLVSVGDGGCWSSPDTGALDENGVAVRGCLSSKTAEQVETVTVNGQEVVLAPILAVENQIGAFRAQHINALNGKILRIWPFNGRGVESNPFYDPSDPNAPRSKIWALGLRNPYRFSVEPGTGSTDPADGDPGRLHIVDVGWNAWEEYDIADQGGLNFGWPVFEGTGYAAHYPEAEVENLSAPDIPCARYYRFTELIAQEYQAPATHEFLNACDGTPIPAAYTHVHKRPVFAWAHNSTQTVISEFDGSGLATAVDMAPDSGTIRGVPFQGFSGLGGIWFDGPRFPDAYRGSYFFADSFAGWVRAVLFDTDGKPVEVREVRPNASGIPVNMTADPYHNAVYYVQYGWSGATGEIRRITAYDCASEIDAYGNPAGNGVHDALDIASGTYLDEDGNGIPDVCPEPPRLTAPDRIPVDPEDPDSILYAGDWVVFDFLNPDAAAGEFGSADPEGDDYIVEMDFGPIWANFRTNPNYREFLWQTADLQMGSWYATFRAFDADNIPVSKTVEIVLALRDCNDNGVVDSADILYGTSPDLNDNDVPDECEPPALPEWAATNPPSPSGTAGNPMGFDVGFNDLHPERVTVTLISGPQGASFDAELRFRWTPPAAGGYWATFRMTDSQFPGTPIPSLNVYIPVTEPPCTSGGGYSGKPFKLMRTSIYATSDCT